MFELSLPKAQTSYWLKKSEQNYPALKDDIEVDVAIAGGGIAGMNTAYLLKKAGLKVAVLEKNTIASGTTGGTTGKVTSQHGIFYAELQEKFGKKTARLYADISREAFNQTANIIRKEKINCSWQIEDNYVYTAKSSKVRKFKKEASIAASLGLPASFETKTGLPFKISAAVKFAGQARFDSHQYVSGLAKIINGDGSYVFENSEVKRVKDGKSCQISTKNGLVTAKSIIIATKIPPGPMIARLSYAAYEYPTTSYIVAGAYGGRLKGMYISPDKNHYSILPIGTDKQPLLLVGGENHLPGLGDSDRRHEKLARYAHKWFGVSKINYRWKAMDYIAYDGLPIAGPIYPWSKNVYVLTGFKKWGLNISMTTAMVIRDLILKQKTPHAKIFYPHRFSALASIPKTAIEFIK